MGIIPIQFAFRSILQLFNTSAFFPRAERHWEIIIVGPSFISTKSLTYIFFHLYLVSVRLDFRRFLESSPGGERGLNSRTAAGSRAYVSVYLCGDILSQKINNNNRRIFSYRNYISILYTLQLSTFQANVSVEHTSYFLPILTENTS